MSEKRVENYLDTLLTDFPSNNIYYSPSENEFLKKVFNNALKTGNKYGIPDRIYYDNKILITFECKINNINDAVNDLKIYKSKMLISDDITYYFVGVSQNNYIIYNNDFNLINKKLSIETFNIIKTNYNMNELKKDIHVIHNYIRDNTKISNEDKSFFIASILISLKKISFKIIIEQYNDKLYIYDLIKNNLHDFNIDFTVFDFLRNDNNNKHFMNIINMINNIYSKNPSNDLLNIFYSEFVRYNNSDGKSLGIVLTPDHIIKLMIHILDIQKDDIFLDLCCGTGSFSLEALTYKPKQIINCEYQNKLFTLMKCNMILRDIDINNNILIKDDCFNQTFKATKSAINPPYGMSDKKELDFIIKQLDSICPGGLICAIIPKSKINSNSVNNKYKEKILKLGKIKLIIDCNKKLFYPNAATETCIILIQKYLQNEKKYDKKLNIVDYSDDGYIIKKQHGLVKTDTFNEKFNKAKKDIKDNSLCDLNNDWFVKVNNEVSEYNITLNDIELKIQEHINYLKCLQNKNKEKKIIKIEHFKKYKLCELFDIKRGKINKNLSNGKYPYISSSGINNGITKFVNEYLFENCVTVANNGSIGSSFYQEGKFYCSSDVSVLIPKTSNMKNKKILLYVCTQLEKYKNVYSYGYKWTLTRMKEDTIILPAKNNEIDYDILQNMFANIKIE